MVRQGFSRVVWAFWAVLVCSCPVWAGPVTVTGQAPLVDGNSRRAEKMALENALRLAVKQDVDILVDAQTRASNHVALQERIFFKASRYISRYNVLSEGVTPDGTQYSLTIKANVQTASIKNELQAMGLLGSQEGKPRFLPVYLPESQYSITRSSRVVMATQQAINAEFARKGFAALDTSSISSVYSEIEHAGRMEASIHDLCALAMKHKVDMLLVYDVTATAQKGGESLYFGGVLVHVSLRAVDPSTESLIAQKHGEGYARTMKKTGDSYEDMQAVKMANDVAKAVSSALAEDALAHGKRARAEGKAP